MDQELALGELGMVVDERLSIEWQNGWSQKGP